MRPDRNDLLSRYGFPLDRFQVEAFDALDAGHHVVVAAPTGSGKTVVAEYGIETMRRAGKRSFYTAPIKALSNQKYRDLADFYGDERVGLLTGDNSINGDAEIVVMTTEVLRNMIYAGSRGLDHLGVVVLDEVHFLQDAYRGPVWEEVIIHLPQHIGLICLSATVSNTAELAEWITTVRGPTDAIIETRRPVELENMYLVADRTNDRLHLLPTLIDGHPNNDAVRLDGSAVRFRRGQRGSRERDDRGLRGSGLRHLATPGRVETVEVLAERGLLPAIYFIFSRNQCDEAAQVCVESGVRFTTDDERARIRTIMDARLDGILDDDLAVLGYPRFRAQLESGVAPHHAGMVPPFKEVVEACFSEGLIRVVFATETLAVGINMPARSVVIEKLTKFTGDHHEQLSPGQYTQLTGRAGRRGIDDRGTAVVCWSPFVRFDQVAELASSRSFHLRSAFRPTYNMAANLVTTYDADEARQLLSLSFAQYQADRGVVKLQSRLHRLHDRLEGHLADAESPFGDIHDYAHLKAAQSGKRGRNDPIEIALMRLRPGSVIYANKGKYRGPVAVVATANRKGGLRLTVVTAGADRLYLAAEDFVVAPKPIGQVRLPAKYAPNRHDYRRAVGRLIKAAKLEPRGPRERSRDSSASYAPHPVENDPDLKERLRALGQARRIQNEIADVESRVEGHHHSLAAEFDGVLEILRSYDMIDLDEWRLTESGERLTRTFHESDLLIALALDRGTLDGLDAPTLAGLVSTFVYEHRSQDEPPRPWFPSGEIAARWRKIEAISVDLAALERSVGLSEHRAPEPTFFAVAHGWVAGEGFADVVEHDLTGGDFVRTMKQLIDVLGQIAQIAGDGGTRRTARQAADAAYRGVVADSAATASTPIPPASDPPVPSSV